MRRSFNPFRKLAWKLTLTYTLVTVAALMVVEAIVMAGVLYFATAMVPNLTAELLVNGMAPLARPFLERNPPDVDGLNAWLWQSSANGITLDAEGGRGVTLRLDQYPQETTKLFVLDAQRNLLAATSPDLRSQLGGSIDLSRVPNLERLLPVALSGESEVSRLSAFSDQDDLTVAAPIRGERGGVLGVLVLTAPKLYDSQPFEGLATLIGWSLLIFTVAAGAVGTVFGFFTARGLTRRLKSVATAASAWGEGHFSETIADSSSDELGQLARQLNQMARQLEDVVQTRQQLAALDERNRLARDLHDSVKQQVFAISMNLGAAQALWERDPSEARGRLEAAASLARQAQQELASLIQTLRPTQLEGKGLAKALRDYTEGWERQSGIAVVYQSRGDESLPLEVEQAVFRVAQEALANVARHSGASATSVTLDATGGRVELQVVDNGRGFDPDGQNGGMGLRSMRERMQALGGTVNVESGRQGTRLLASVPFDLGARGQRPGIEDQGSGAQGRTG